MRVAIVDDNKEVSELISIWLEGAGHNARPYLKGRDFIQAYKSESFDVILLDWVLPDLDGEQILEWLQNTPDWNTPVIFITARSSEEDIAKILDQGADDYVTKPIQRRELLARINAVTRRLQKYSEQKVLEFGAYNIDMDARKVSVNGKPVKLTEMEFNLVCFIFRNIGRLLSRNHILASVWGYDAGVNTRTVDTHMSRIRKKLNITPENGWRLTSIYQRGYRLEQVSQDETIASDV